MFGGVGSTSTNPVLIENTPAARERNYLRNQQRL
jgi:hypothetical protein